MLFLTIYMYLFTMKVVRPVPVKFVRNIFNSRLIASHLQYVGAESCASRVTPAGEWSPFSDTQSRRLHYDP